LTGITDQNLVFSGSIPISATNSLFFTYYGVDGQKDKNLLKNSPLLIVVGNPGTSAQYYSLGGIGPLNLNNDMTLSPNSNSFTNTANVMFLDLLGSGFSFVSNPADLPSQAWTFG
jgi:carboxypeptidase C (cathepsin A)